MDNLSNTNSELEASQLQVKVDKKVVEAYTNLHKTIDEMDRKVELVIKKHESQFLYAYQNHIKKIKKQLYEIKEKADMQEKMFSANDRLRYLEKEVTMFREESIKLYQKLHNKNAEIDILKNKVIEAEKNAIKYENEAKDILKINMKLQANWTEYEQTILSLQRDIEEKQQQIERLKNRYKKQKVNTLEKVSLMSSRKTQPKIYQTHSFTPNSMNDYELKEWFVECIRSVKKEIGQRKNSFSDLDIYKIKNLDEFRLVDKLRLFELFLENQKLTTWMYQKIFPDRLIEMNDYLSISKNEASQGQLQKEQSETKQHKSNRYSEDFSLPRLTITKKNLVRNQVSLTNGKLNISLS